MNFSISELNKHEPLKISDTDGTHSCRSIDRSSCKRRITTTARKVIALFVVRGIFHLPFELINLELGITRPRNILATLYATRTVEIFYQTFVTREIVGELSTSLDRRYSFPLFSIRELPFYFRIKRRSSEKYHQLVTAGSSKLFNATVNSPFFFLLLFFFRAAL